MTYVFVIECPCCGTFRCTRLRDRAICEVRARYPSNWCGLCRGFYDMPSYFAEEAQ